MDISTTSYGGQRHSMTLSVSPVSVPLPTIDENSEFDTRHQGLLEQKEILLEKKRLLAEQMRQIDKDLDAIELKGRLHEKSTPLKHTTSI